MEKRIIEEMAHIIADIFKKEEELDKLKRDLKIKAVEYYEEEKEEKEIELYDKVTVIKDLESSERIGGFNYIGESGVVIEIDENYKYPYMIKFDNPNLDDDWLWKKEELNFKQGEW